MSKDRPQNNREAAERTAAAEDGKGFFARWMQRKTRASTGKQQKKQVADVERPMTILESDTGSVTTLAQVTDAETPPLETLDENSDVSAFFSPKVSDSLRRLALRRLFHLPAFNLTDGLDDYAEDYHGFAELGDIITADMRHQMQRLATEAQKQPHEKTSKSQAKPDSAGAPAANDTAEPRNASQTETGEAKKA